MGKRTLVHVAAAVALLGASCTRSGLTSLADSGTQIDASLNSSGAGGAKGGTADAAGSGGASGGVFVLPDGGLLALIGDNNLLGGILDAGTLGGILDAGTLGGIMDASRDSLLGQAICDSKVKTGDACSSATTPGCVLSNLGGLCVCLNGAYFCPQNTSQAPQACPSSAATGTPCSSALSTCIGGSANACVCGLGTYICL
jgi:hypothetical protein